MIKLAKFHAAPPKHGECAPFGLMLLFPEKNIDYTVPRGYSLGSIAVNLGIENEVFSLSITTEQVENIQKIIAPKKAILIYLDCMVSTPKGLVPHFVALILTSDRMVLIDARLGYSVEINHAELLQHCTVQRAAFSTKQGEIIIYEQECFAHILIENER